MHWVFFIRDQCCKTNRDHVLYEVILEKSDEILMARAEPPHGSRAPFNRQGGAESTTPY